MQFYTKRIKEAGISYHRFISLYHFALDYPNLLSRRNSEYDLHVSAPSGMPKGSSVSSTTERQALSAMRAGEKVEAIELCLKKAVAPDIGLYEQLKKNVCYGVPFIELDIPCSINSLTVYRNRFYILLNNEIL